MAAVLCDSEGVLVIDSVDQGLTITRDYYGELIQKLCHIVSEKCMDRLLTVTKMSCRPNVLQ